MKEQIRQLPREPGIHHLNTPSQKTDAHEDGKHEHLAEQSGHVHRHSPWLRPAASSTMPFSPHSTMLTVLTSV